ncbi:HpcH/HpaI aldolase/citrate lyase family protein [Marinobacter xestospongiae]|uniref:HpcH/HpaI aldolase/citrate lyase family protein n=1 Tax=Marinobacter xestospongiae TaxID=994319 RepID=UPI002006D7A0|nr:CoA ester lyase [Marinobacter xestospongiae]MCK7568581.1 CoA ester lyase [Marinobacter xestospongiae]
MKTPGIMRSLLYVPGQNDKLVSKAVVGAADVIVLDLEDAVPASSKPEARQALAGHCERIRAAGKQSAVRVNAPDELLALDLPAVIDAGCDLLVLPKVESAKQVQHVAATLADTEIGIIGLVESPAGLLNAPEIASADARLLALSIGTEDLSFDMGMTPCWDSLLVPTMQVNIACKAAGIELLGYVGSIAEFRDIDAFEASVSRSLTLGIVGGFAIHPAQIEVLNRLFSPDAADVAQAQRIVAAFEQAKRDHLGVAAVDGKMIDLPVALRAERLLARQALVTGKQDKP